MSKGFRSRAGARVRRYVTAGTALALALALAGCGGDGDAEEASSSEDIHILALLGLSGLAAPSAEVLEAGAQAAVEVANEAGGVDGRKVVIKFVDTQSDPARAVSVLKNEIAKQRPDMVYGGSSSTEVVAMLPALTQEKLPFVTNVVATDVGIGSANPYSFSSISGQDVQAGFYAETFQEKGIDRIGFLYPDVPAGTSAADAYTKILPEAGIEVVESSYEADALDMSAQLERLDAENVDAVLIWSVGPAGGYILKSRYKIGMTIPFYTDTATAATANIASIVTPEEGEGVTLATWNLNLKADESDYTQGSIDLMAQLAADKVTYKSALSLYAFSYDAILLGLNGMASAEDPSDVESWTAAMIEQGDPTFQLAISSEKTGWEPENRFRQDMGGYALFPASTPLVDGHFEVQ